MSLRCAIEATRICGERWLWGRDGSIELTGFLSQTCLAGYRNSLRDKSVLILTDNQLIAAAALIELDGIASRILVCPPDIKPDYVPLIATHGDIDAVVTAGAKASAMATGISKTINCEFPPSPSKAATGAEIETDWLLLTSGTTGVPKIVRHTFRSLTGAIRPAETNNMPPVWSTFYDIRRYGGLQIYLRAVVGGGSMVLSDADEPVSDFLMRLAHHGVTRISGTPSHWRRALMSTKPDIIVPSYVRLSGEIADQKILDSLKEAYPNAAVDHAYATTEAGVGFVVEDGIEGFPASLLGDSDHDVQIQIVDDTLRIRSSRTATCYVGSDAPSLTDINGFVDSGDIVERRADRYYFVGRRGGIINVGGLKVHPEEIESVINRHRSVHMSHVKSRKSPFTGSIIVADVVLNPDCAADDQDHLRSEILTKCREILPSYKIPALLHFVPKLDLAKSGKLIRTNA